MRGVWDCSVCGHQNSVLLEECENTEAHELLRCDRIIAGARYAAVHNIKPAPAEPPDNWKDFVP